MTNRLLTRLAGFSVVLMLAGVLLFVTATLTDTPNLGTAAVWLTLTGIASAFLTDATHEALKRRR